MKETTEKKGLFERLKGSNKAKKNSCCCNFKIEEIPKDITDEKERTDSSKSKDNSCCNK